MVSELVPTGGRITVGVDIVVPGLFALYSSLRSSRGRPCRVIKRDGSLIEFEFLPTKADQERTAQKSGATR